MYARSTTVQGSPQKLDEGIAYVRDQVMPMVEQMDGCVGLSMLADRASGRCIVTTAWETQEAMRASADAVRDSRARAGEILGGRAEVAEWEIGILHRARPAPEGAACRVVWSHGDPDDGDRALDAFRMTVLPRLEELPGFCSVSLLGNRDTGRAVLATVYESREAMDRASAIVTPMRDGFTRSMGGEITEVGEFELVLAHLRVPETV